LQIHISIFHAQKTFFFYFAIIAVFIPILIAGHKEQTQQIKEKNELISELLSKNSVQQQQIDDLNSRLSQLENCLKGILSSL
jgi:uncharacterized protein YlxW (UPF0749 family)